MKDFPVHTGLTIAVLGLLLTGIRLFVPTLKGLEIAHFAAIIDFAAQHRVLIRGGAESGQSATPVSRLKSTVLLDDSHGALDHFYGALLRSERHESGAVTRIVHYGDSPTTADLVTGPARSLLQKRFGNAGHGFVLLEKPWAWYQHTGVDIYGSGWLIVPATQFDAPDGLFGLGGVSFSGDPPARSRIVFRRERYSQFEVFYLRQPGGGVFSVVAGGQILGQVETSDDSISAGFARFRVEPAAGDLAVQVDQGRVRLFGVTAENAGPGVVYDSLGLNGGSITVLARKLNQAHWTEELRHRRPDLIIVNYGTNEAGFAPFVDKAYGIELREVIRRIRAALPNSSILIMSPMDRGERRESAEIETMPTIPRIVDLQRSVALDTGCAFFDTFGAMGGEGTMARWYAAEPRLVAADLIHPFVGGGNIIARIFATEIGKGFNSFKASHPDDADQPREVR